MTTTPEVRNGGKEVRLAMHGEFTYIRELLANQYPLTHSVTFDAQVDIPDGETAILDGLLPAGRALEAVSAVPLLADLPCLGHLFRGVEPDDEVYLMLTPNSMK